MTTKYECHGHIMADGASYANAVARHCDKPDTDAVHDAFAALKAHGIEYFRDGGDRYGVSQLAQSIAPEFGIEYRTPIFIIHREGYYGKLYGKSYANMREAAALVREAKSLGADFIKITVSGMLDFDGDGGVLYDAIGFEEIREIVNIASGEGFAVMAHCNGADNIKNALEAGISSLEHGFWIDEEGIAMLGETKSVWVPTCVTVSNVISEGRYPETTMRRIFDHHAKMLRAASKTGALIACGSDSGAYGVPHGRGAQDEAAMLTMLGIDPSRGNAEIAMRMRR